MKLSLVNNSVRSCLLALVVGLMLPVPASHADIITLTGNLTGALEVPPVNSPGTAQATITLDTFAHIHNNAGYVRPYDEGSGKLQRLSVAHDGRAHSLLPGFSVSDRR